MLISKVQAALNQTVKLVTNRWNDELNNPVWGGKFGNVKGTVISVNATVVKVRWENGSANLYEEGDLELYVEVPAAKTVTPVSLADAVKSVVVNYFTPQNIAFSAYDVVSKLRRDVNEGFVVINNLPIEDVNGIKTQRIERVDVRAALRDFMDTQTNFNRVFNGTYFLYTPNGTSAPVASAPVVRDTVGAPTLTITTTGNVSSQTAPVGPAPTIAPSAIKAYISNRGSRTLKQIQSRFKTEGQRQPTVRDLALAATNAGLRFDARSPYYASVVSL